MLRHDTGNTEVIIQIKTNSLNENVSVNVRNKLEGRHSHTPSVLLAVRDQATCRVSMMTCTVSLSILCLNTVITIPISRSRLMRLFLYSVRSPCWTRPAITAFGHTLTNTSGCRKLLIAVCVAAGTHVASWNFCCYL